MTDTEIKRIMLTWEPLFAGATAGFAVDTVLYPLDTIKTRLQSSVGFAKSGGFKGAYRGFSAAAVGSAPGAALFFTTYENGKKLCHHAGLPLFATHAIASSVGEIVACLVRVPIENVKQNMQVGTLDVLRRNLKVSRLYRGFGATLSREIPFAMIQFPVYERLKTAIQNGEFPSKIHLASCGAAAGSFAAFCTTPLDVIKTRMMTDAKSLGFYSTLSRTCREGHLFAGAMPRVCWMGLGGFIFFGAYEQAIALRTDISTASEDH